MNAEKAPHRLLVIDTEAALVDSLARHFTAEGYQVQTALSGQDGIQQAQAERPDVILLAARLDDMAGLDVLRMLRDVSRTSHIPVMILAGRSEALLQNKVLEEGAYDFIEKPIDLDILALRVRNALRRAEREGYVEPRTSLPTGRLIQERLDALEREDDWYRIDLSLAEFGVFRDRYGFMNANEALRFAGNVITQLVNEHGSASDFVGHHGGTEAFIVVTHLAYGSQLRDLLAQRLNEELASFYNFEERDRGYVVVEDGAGGSVHKPLMSVRIQVTSSAPEAASPPDDAAAVDHAEQSAAATSASDDAGSSDDPFDW